MIKTEITLLTNNIITPFQDINLDFVHFNKLFATRSIAEHGLGFMINLKDSETSEDDWGYDFLKTIIFDTGSVNKTFLYNMDVRAYNPQMIDEILISHWHYDHTGALYPLIEQIEKEIKVVCHESAKTERFFKRSKEVKDDDLEGKRREEILPFLFNSKIVNQEPINLKIMEKFQAKVIFSKDAYEVFNNNGLKITLSGEIPRIHPEELHYNFYSLQGETLQKDKILDDKCLILEFPEKVVVLLGCCHSGIMNTLDYVKSLTTKRISHVIGGFHMVGVNQQRINETLKYLENFQDNNENLYLFPIHCTGDKFLSILQNKENTKWKVFNASVGTVFSF